MTEGLYPKDTGSNKRIYASEGNGSFGKIIIVEAGENITADDLVYVKASDGKCYVSDTGTADDIRSNGIAHNTDTTGNDIYIQTRGVYVTSGLTANDTYYLGASGALSLTPSAVKVGTSLSTTELFIDIVQDDKDVIGTIKAWAKTLTGVPTYSAFWHECSSSAISDAESPLNGQTINLNTTQRFLRGNTTSTTTGGSDTHAHGISTGSSLGCTGQYQPAGSTGSASSLPAYYEVVWLIKKK